MWMGGWTGICRENETGDESRRHWLCHIRNADRPSSIRPTKIERLTAVLHSQWWTKGLEDVCKFIEPNEVEMYYWFLCSSPIDSIPHIPSSPCSSAPIILVSNSPLLGPRSSPMREGGHRPEDFAALRRFVIFVVVAVVVMVEVAIVMFFITRYGSRLCWRSSWGVQWRNILGE